MIDFSDFTCEACYAGAPVATEDELNEFLGSHRKWEKVEIDQVPRLTRVYTFGNFVDALDFTNRIGNIAEEVGHHPALLTEWGKVTVSIMAAKSDNLYV